MSDITVSSDIHTFMQSASNSAARDNLGVGDTDDVNHASLVLTGTAESSQFIGPLRGEVLFRGQAAEAITKGQAVYVSGISGNTPVVSLADSSNSAKMPAFGLAASTVSASQSVDVVTFGTLSAIDTSTYSLGATLYVNGSGSLSATKPTGESSFIQNIGKVQRVHATSGSIKVGGAGRTNDTPNLDENKIFIGNSSNAASTAAISTVITDNASSVKTSYESNSDTNAFTDAEKTKLSGIATGAEVNAVDSVNSQTGAVTLDADDIDDTATAHRFATAAQLTKLDGIETAATADQNGAEIKSLYEAEANTNAFTDAEKTKLAGIATGAEVNAVDSVNTQTGSVVLDADDISDAATTNKFTTAADISKLAGIEAGADVTDATNVSAAGAPIISSGAGVPSSTPSKVGDIYIDTTSDDAYIAVGTASASDWEKSNDGSGSGATNLSWTASTSTISSSSGTDATLTNADGTNAGLMSSSDKTKLDGIASGAEVNAVDSVNTQTGAVVLDADDISDSTTTNKFTTAADISKLAGIAAGAEVNAVDSVNTQTGAVVLDADDISDASTTNKFTTASDISKLAGIEAGADVTDSTNVSAAGAPIISSGAGVPSTTPSKVGDIYIDTTSDDAYIAVGTASASDWEKSNDGAGSGSTNLSWSASTSTVSSSTGTDATLTNADGTNAGLMSSSDKTKLDGIASGAEVNTVDSVNTQIGTVVLDADDISDAATTNKFTTASDITKLAGIEAGADVTDTANVTAAGALMDSEVDADIKTLSLPANTTISAFGASLVDDADAATARATLGVDAAGTDNSTNVTLTGTGTYLSIAGQVITVDPITESDISDLGTYLTAESDTLDSVTGRGATTTNAITVGSIDVNGEIIELAVNTTGVTGSTALDPANGTIQRLTFSGNVTFTDSLANGESITLHIDDGTAYTATWPTMEWVGGSAPTLDTTNETIIVIWKVNATLYGMTSGVSS